jgi:heme exporter protein A
MSLIGESLTCERGGLRIFAGLGFELAAGSVLILRGANGAGKSSLLRIVSTLLKPAAGRLLYDGSDIDEDPDAHRRRICFVGHHDALKGALSAAENLQFWLGLHGGSGAVTDALAAFGVDHLAATPVQYLSAGQKRRVALARTAMSQAPLWLLDEPTVSLDDDGVACLQRVIARHRQNGGMVMAATHIDLGVENADVLELKR